jgi:PAS domain S-box-containing protein
MERRASAPTTAEGIPYVEILEASTAVLIALIGIDGRIAYVNAASRWLLGYEPEELVGRAGAGLLHPDDRHRLARARAARSESTFEARLLRKAGDFIWVEVSLRPVWGRGTDRLLGVTTIVRDISDRRDLRERMRARDEVRRFTPGHTPPNQTAA